MVVEAEKVTGSDLPNLLRQVRNPFLSDWELELLEEAATKMEKMAEDVEHLKRIKHYLNEDLLDARSRILDLQRTVRAWEATRGDR